MGVPALSQAWPGRGQEAWLLPGSASTRAKPRDFCEDSWPLAGASSPFGPLTCVV